MSNVHPIFKPLLHVISGGLEECRPSESPASFNSFCFRCSDMYRKSDEAQTLCPNCEAKACRAFQPTDDDNGPEAA